jgi:branched-chain amino acid transport system ATP-binding protein
MMDEPSLGLGPLVVAEVFRVIQEIRAEGVTILLVEQNANAALKIADQAYVLETGRIVLEGTGADLLENPRVKQYYLGEKTAVQAHVTA